MGNEISEDKVYCPSNGSEGDWFIEKYCMNCKHCDPNPDGAKQCDILLRSLSQYPTDEKYPMEWIYKGGKPTCTKHEKWNWKKGDPDKYIPKLKIKPDGKQQTLF